MRLRNNNNNNVKSSFRVSVYLNIWELRNKSVIKSNTSILKKSLREPLEEVHTLAPQVTWQPIKPLAFVPRGVT